jgi:hypothetical protein
MARSNNNCREGSLDYVASIARREEATYASLVAASTTGAVSERRRTQPPPPPFAPNPQDEYAKPRLHGLVSYLFHENPTKQYRTGVLCSNDGELRFFNGRQEDGVPGFNSYNFYLTEKYFNKGFFRPRPDLEPGR